MPRILALLLILFAMRAAPSQSTFLARYEQRVAATLDTQPHWTSPLITVSPRIEQGFRTDFIRQTAATTNGQPGQTTWNYGGSKGLQFIPFRRVEIRFSPPPFFTHSNSKTIDGFGDTAFRLKYRLYASPEQHHNAIVTFDLNATVPTGKNGNGSCCAVVTPVLFLGKGFGPLALTSSAGGSLPVTNTQKLGRSVLFNNAVQYHATKVLWLETEFNSTFFYGGKSDGHVQTFTTPGVILSRIPLNRIPQGTPGFLQITLGAGEQIALTHFHTYDHSPVFTARLRF